VLKRDVKLQLTSNRLATDLQLCCHCSWLAKFWRVTPKCGTLGCVEQSY